MNIAENILLRGQDTAPALLEGGAVLTYGELRAQVDALAGGLLAQGHRKGDRIGILSENNRFFVKAYLGIIRAGLVAVPFPVDASMETFTQIAATATLSQVFVSRRFMARARDWAGKVGVTVVPEGAEPELPDRARVPMPEIDPARDLAALMFTSGSTGFPKGVMITHRNLQCNTRDIIAYMELGPQDRVMTVLPLHYCFGLSLLHTHLMQGASLVLNNDFRLFPESVLQELEEKNAPASPGFRPPTKSCCGNRVSPKCRCPTCVGSNKPADDSPIPALRKSAVAFPGFACS
jgi:acyl-CoA synthetase (AMP-forming)/AMP-acid ligase II